MERVRDLPAIACRRDALPARLYNAWRRARRRRLLPLREPIPGMKEMDLIVEADGIAVVDRNRGDVPVLAWTAFDDAGRDALHAPVACTLNYYHFMASSLRARALAHAERALEAVLAGRGGG